MPQDTAQTNPSPAQDTALSPPSSPSLEKFVDDLIRAKNFPKNLDTAVKKQIKKDLMMRVNDFVNARLIAALPEKDAEESEAQTERTTKLEAELKRWDNYLGSDRNKTDAERTFENFNFEKKKDYDEKLADLEAKAKNPQEKIDWLKTRELLDEVPLGVILQRAPMLEDRARTESEEMKKYLEGRELPEDLTEEEKASFNEWQKYAIKSYEEIQEELAKRPEKTPEVATTPENLEKTTEMPVPAEAEEPGPAVTGGYQEEVATEGATEEAAEKEAKEAEVPPKEEKREVFITVANPDRDKPGTIIYLKEPRLVDGQEITQVTLRTPEDIGPESARILVKAPFKGEGGEEYTGMGKGTLFNWENVSSLHFTEKDDNKIIIPKEKLSLETPEVETAIWTEPQRKEYAEKNSEQIKKDLEEIRETIQELTRQLRAQGAELTAILDKR